MRLGAQLKTQNSKFLTRTASAVRHALFHRFVKKRTCAADFHILFIFLPCHSEFCYSIHAALRLEEFLIWYNSRQLFAAWVFVEYKL